MPQQLGAPAFALARTAAESAGGTSTITVTVAPDHLGPITIRASMSADGTRLEFFSTTDGGREALKLALPDLRREASSAGLSASLDLGTGTPGERDAAAQPGSGRQPRPEALDEPPGPRRSAAPAAPWTPRPPSATSTLDLFA
ncbi:flagellar hook-length control protein FliK [Arthrobacter agilis]|uniref:flagellar hook-length control protein FliK n=1 Tax=Arthrobacter agilis TaxID=37921 RepID=UPI000B362F08|nr:flagellar hook-length control protein FliK [Arthrobacter agilis]OUM43741.1 hypothetical protein B8W74_06235 [Arthrobacter agilis]PPB46674.1 flagellar hook-length control protein FliK [Arthrobacter agilis]TPV24983.1 flagellar hook-length control protein FliK [Arthrobacter agilis]